VNRREIITLLSGAAAWPLAARAQQGERMRRIGFLIGLAPDDSEGLARVTAFSQGLQERGWTVGRNLRVEFRSAGGLAANYRKYAEELIALAPDVFLAGHGDVLLVLSKPPNNSVAVGAEARPVHPIRDRFAARWQKVAFGAKRTCRAPRQRVDPTRLPSRPGELHPEPLTDSGREPLDSSGSCHRTKAAGFR
jgi:hypothetical protein